MRLALILLVVIFLVSSESYSKVWTVSPEGEYKFCSDVAPLVEHGDTILIESNMYENDEQVTWRKDNLVIKGINGTPFLQAGDKILQNISNGKAIFVIQGRNNIVENIEFSNCKVNDNNGSGIRQEGANLTVRSCIFRNNEMGILCGSIPDCKIVIEYSQFYNNGSHQNPGYQHNIYINHVDTLIFRFNLSLNAEIGRASCRERV